MIIRPDKMCTACKEVKSIYEFGRDSQKRDGLCSQCKTCKRVKVDAWMNANKSRVAVKKRAWTLANRDRVRRVAKELLAKHPERVVAYSKKYYRLHPDKAKEWAKNHPDLVRAAYLRWKKANPDAVALFNRNSKLKRKGVDGRHLKADIDRIWTLQRGKCAVCHCDLKKSGKHKDHIMPIALGGDNFPSNIQLLCPPCNLKKNAKHPVDFMQQLGRLL